VNDSRTATYSRLIEAQALIARACERRGTPVKAIEDALEISESSAPERESDRELYLGTLRRYVEALGGALRGEGGLEAIFPEQNIGLPPAPD
jgi:hypothetical protein